MTEDHPFLLDMRDKGLTLLNDPYVSSENLNQQPQPQRQSSFYEGYVNPANRQLCVGQEQEFGGNGARGDAGREEQEQQGPLPPASSAPSGEENSMSSIQSPSSLWSLSDERRPWRVCSGRNLMRTKCNAMKHCCACRHCHCQSVKSENCSQASRNSKAEFSEGKNSARFEPYSGPCGYSRWTENQPKASSMCDQQKICDQSKCFQQPRICDQPKSFEQPRTCDQPKKFQQPRICGQPKSFEQLRTCDQPKSCQQPRTCNQPKSIQQPRKCYDQPRNFDQSRAFDQSRSCEQPMDGSTSENRGAIGGRKYSSAPPTDPIPCNRKQGLDKHRAYNRNHSGDRQGLNHPQKQQKGKKSSPEEDTSKRHKR